MEKQEQLRVIRGLMSHLDNGTNVDAGGQVRNPVSSYTSQEIADSEWQSFYQDYTHMLGLSADLPQPGTFFTSMELDKPILCTRDQGGKFRAFLNVCRHRGTIVEDESRGQKNIFSCPFHAWGYNHCGELVAVPKEEHFGPVEKSAHSLVPLPAEEKHGILWVHPNPEGSIELDEQLGELGPELESWNLARYNYLKDTTYDHAMNWKLAIDTFGETYHFNTLHKDTLAADFYGNCQMYDTYNRNHRMSLCLKNIDTLRDQPEDDWHVLAAALPVYYIFPNIQLILGDAGPTLVRVYPDGANPNQSFSKISFYLHPDVEKLGQTEDGREIFTSIEERMDGFASIIQAEDYVAAASSHVGAQSGAQDYVIFGRNEPALHHYHNTYRSALGLPPLEVVSN